MTLKLLLKFACGAFGSFLILAFRGIPPLPGLGHIASIWLGLIFVFSGSFVTLIFQIGDNNVLRSFIFGLTWPPLIAALTPPPSAVTHQAALLVAPILKNVVPFLR